MSFYDCFHRPACRHGLPRRSPLASALRAALLGMGIAITVAPLSAPAAMADETAVISYDIPAGPLGRSLTRFASRAGITLSYEPALVAGLSAPALRGTFSVVDGLHRLLSGAGLEAAPVEGGFRVQRAAREKPVTLAPVRVSAGGLAEATEGTGSYTTGALKSATGLSLSMRDTPQSVSVVTSERIRDQGMATVADALRSTTGISVKATDRGRNSISARGFDINNFQIDGVPFVTGNIGIETANTAIYDRVEVVRGATGLLSGAGDPSATVNLVRKHAASETFTGTASVEIGSWDRAGGTIDMTTPLTANGAVRARVVASHSQREAFIDLEETDNSVFYAVLDADLGEHTYLTLGASYEKTNRDGVYWGGLPYFYADGSRTNWDRSTTTAARWNAWDTEEQTAFVTLAHTLDNGWVLSADGSYYTQQEDSNLLWVTGEPDRVTGLGMSAYPYLYATNPEQYQVSLSATGPFHAWGREHELTLRVLHSENKNGWDNGGVPLSPIAPVGDFNQWDGSYPRPVWGEPEIGDRNTRTQTAFYGAVRLQITDALKAILGGRVTDWKVEEEVGAWTPEAYEIRHDGVFVPYVGLIYDLSASLSAYASYSSIFKPQTARDRNGKYLDPLEGDTYEAGLKGEFFDGGLNVSAAIFAVRQENYAVQDGDNLIPGTNTFASRGVKGTEIDGYEFEVSGALTPDWEISLGWTQFSAESPEEGVIVAEDHPRKLLRLFTKYHLPGYWQGLSVGAGVTWQDDERSVATNPVTEADEKVGESAYAVVDLMAKYQIDKQWSAQLNVDNVFDKKYKESSWGTFTYGEPRNALLTVNYHW